MSTKVEARRTTPLPRLPPPYWRARLTRIIGVAGIVIMAVLGWVLAGDAVGVVMSAAIILALARALSSLRLAYGSLLVMETLPRNDVAMAVSRLEEVAQRVRDPRVTACVVASLAELELHDGDVRRGLRLFADLRARGWAPRTLVAGWTSAYASVVDAAATFATVEAAAGDVEDASRTLDALGHAAALTSTRLLRAVVHLRRGEPQNALRVLQASAGASLEPAGRADAVALLRAFAIAHGARPPYRAPLPPLAGPPERDRLRWLIASSPAIRAFVEGHVA